MVSPCDGSDVGHRHGNGDEHGRGDRDVNGPGYGNGNRNGNAQVLSIKLAASPRY